MTVQTANPLPNHAFLRNDGPTQGQSSAPAASNAITLSFNGVDFKLVPSAQNTAGGDAGTSACTSISTMSNGNGNFTVLNLNSFTGSLIVSESSSITQLNETPANINVGMGITPSMRDGDAIQDHSMAMARTVEDEPPSPEHKEAQETPLQKGQQQLPFVQKNQKRANVRI